MLGKEKIGIVPFLWTNYPLASLISLYKNRPQHIPHSIIFRKLFLKNENREQYKHTETDFLTHALAIHLRSQHPLVYTILKCAWGSFPTSINLFHLISSHQKPLKKKDFYYLWDQYQSSTCKRNATPLQTLKAKCYYYCIKIYQQVGILCIYFLTSIFPQWV